MNYSVLLSKYFLGKLRYIGAIGCIFIILACKTNKINKLELDTYRVAFYNVENLFDCEDNPNKIDDDFTPDGRNKWDNTRYQKKLGQLNKVFAGMEYPVLIGLSEVENSTVLKDLCVSLSSSSGRTYQFIHYDSPDKRGIDCALLYQEEVFAFSTSEIIRIPFPEEIAGEPDYTSRDILQVEGQLGKEKIFLFVNHWPSRRGGLKKSEPRRVHVASYLKKRTDSLYQINTYQNILLLGDFNDEPNNRSITETFSTQSTSPQFHNLMDPLDQAGKGSYNYRGNWNMLDQILVSPSLKDGKGLDATVAYIYEPEWLCFNHPRFGRTPNRTYGGPNYYGGYSDHFPVYTDLKK